jgi:flagellar motility protein MotE (MotC chaperone)
MIRLDFFSSLLILMLITLSVKVISLASKIQDQTKYTFVTQADSALIDTAYAEDAKKPQENMAKDVSEDNAKPDLAPQNQPVSKLETNLPNLQSGYSKEEMRILQELSTRRQALDKTEESLNMKANVLKATENKLEQKVSELKSLQDQVSELMKDYGEQEDAKYRSLVKIYENMKPREAAKIFDELEMDMLVQIITRMKEARSAPIIASMHPSKAKELSIELTKYKSLD